MSVHLDTYLEQRYTLYKSGKSSLTVVFDWCLDSTKFGLFTSLKVIKNSYCFVINCHENFEMAKNNASLILTVGCI